MWSDFNPKALNRDQLVARLNAMTWRLWKPIGITLHNTAAPTLAQWAESGAKHDARIRNLQSYYEGMGWHGGPHWFVSRNWINEFSNPLRRGTHSPSFNGTHFGIEMVGDYNREPFNSGDGALVRNNAVFLMAELCKRFGWDIVKVLKLHKEDPRTDHDCPGKNVVKSDIINRVKDEIAGKSSIPPPVLFDRPPQVETRPLVAAGIGTLNTHIYATEFGFIGDEEPGKRSPSAYGGRIDPGVPGVALPVRFEGKTRPKVRVFYKGKSVLCEIVDVGPWNTDDRYWATSGKRPQAESGRDKRGRRTNLAGIDLTPAACDALGIPGRPKLRSAHVDWEFGYDGRDV